MANEQPARTGEDEIDETLTPGGEEATPDQAGQQDFAARNVVMSNALPGNASPVAGAVIGSGGGLGMQPETDEEEVEEAEEARD